MWSVVAEIDRSSNDPDQVRDGLFFQRQIDGAQRSTVLHDVFFDSDPGWLPAFVVMLPAGPSPTGSPFRPPSWPTVGIRLLQTWRPVPLPAPIAA